MDTVWKALYARLITTFEDHSISRCLLRFYLQNQSVYQIYFFEPEEVGSTDHSTGILMKGNPALTKMLVEVNVNGTGEARLWKVHWLPLRSESHLIGKQSLIIMSKNTHPEHSCVCISI